MMFKERGVKTVPPGTQTKREFWLSYDGTDCWITGTIGHFYGFSTFHFVIKRSWVRMFVLSVILPLSCTISSAYRAGVGVSWHFCSLIKESLCGIDRKSNLVVLFHYCFSHQFCLVICIDYLQRATGIGLVGTSSRDWVWPQLLC